MSRYRAGTGKKKKNRGCHLKTRNSFNLCIKKALERSINWREHIIIDPAVLTGKPIIKGTRLAVEFIIDLLAHNWTGSEILRNYPGRTHEDIQAYLMYVIHVREKTNPRAAVKKFFPY